MADTAISQDIHHAAESARVSEEVSRGVFSNASLIVQAPGFFAVDFLSTVAQPKHVAARVILPATALAELLSALRHNLAAYEHYFGPMAHPDGVLPRPECPEFEVRSRKRAGGEDSSVIQNHTPAQLQVADLYDQLKIPEKVLGGAFANVVLIRHTAYEFSMDFISNMFPQAVVTTRVFMPASRIPQFIDAVGSALERSRERP